MLLPWLKTPTPWLKTEQIAHVSSPSSDIEQKTRVTLLRQFVGLRWSTGAKTLRNLPSLWSTQQLSTARHSGVAALTFATKTVS